MPCRAVVLSLLTLFLAGCQACSDAPAPEGRTSAERVPNPPFVEPLPAGAWTVEDIEPGRHGGDLVLAVTASPRTFNPLMGSDGITVEVVHIPMYAPCWRFDYVKQAGGPGLCAQAEQSEDGLTWTFTLREGLRWSDGQPLTTDDVAFTWQVLMDPEVPAPGRSLFEQGKTEEGKPRYAGFEQVDPLTFRITLYEPIASFPLMMSSVRWVPKHTLHKVWKAGRFTEALGVNTPPEQVVTSGAFRPVKYRADEQVVLERNPHFWQVDSKKQRLPYLDRVIFLVVPDQSAAFLKFRQGETHAWNVPTDHYDRLVREAPEKGYLVHELGASLNTAYLMFNLDPGLDDAGQPVVDPIKRGWFERLGFRQAISHALDREGMVRSVLHGRGEPLCSFISPGNVRWAPPPHPTCTFDLDKSRALLAAEGFVERDGKLHDPEGHEVTFSVVTNAENSVRVHLLNVIKEDLARLGISVRVRPVPFNELLAALKTHRRFEGLVLGWGTAVPPDPALFKNVFLSSAPNHFWHPSQKTPARPWEAKMDTLAIQVNTLVDEQARKKASDELMALFSTQQAQTMLVVEQAYAASRSELGNFKPTPLRPRTHWNIEQLYLKSLPR